MRIFRHAALCLALFTATVFASNPEDSQSIRDRVLGTTGIERQGETIFNASCALCHGHGGTGGQGRPLARRSFDPESWFNTISKGRIRGGKRMPPFENSLSEEQRWQLIAYLLTLK